MKPELWWSTYFTRPTAQVEVDFRWITLPTRHRAWRREGEAVRIFMRLPGFARWTSA